LFAIWISSKKTALFKFFSEKQLAPFSPDQSGKQGEWLKIGLKMNKIAIFF
jgi:hypothetical protein